MIHEHKTGFHRQEKVHEMGLIPSTRALMKRQQVSPWAPQPQVHERPQLTIVSDGTRTP